MAVHIVLPLIRVPVSAVVGTGAAFPVPVATAIVLTHTVPFTVAIPIMVLLAILVLASVTTWWEATDFAGVLVIGLGFAAVYLIGIWLRTVAEMAGGSASFTPVKLVVVAIVVSALAAMVVVLGSMVSVSVFFFLFQTDRKSVV